VGPAGWIQHTNFGGYLGQSYDFEQDGNAGWCPQFPPYDMDETFADGDAGLAFPQPYTIVQVPSIPPIRVVPAPNSMGTSLGQTCSVAAWGQSIDIYVVNNMPSVGYMNVLLDWNGDGQWSGFSVCPSANAPEHVLVNFPVPNNNFMNFLSVLGPPPFLIGPQPGFVWARFSLTEQPVTLPWKGDGQFEDGETEDYLIYIGDYELGDAPENAPAYSNGTVGNFPTCINVGSPTSYIRHTPGASFMGNTVDGEFDGNSNFCPAFSPNFYDRDECQADNDAGLTLPSAFTLNGNNVQPCTPGPTKALDKFCATATWGTDIDMIVTGPGYLNVLMDWDQDGNWAYNPATVCSGTPVAEHVMVDFQIPPGFSGPVSLLMPPPFTVGPNTGFVWTRFTLSDIPLNTTNWSGSGEFLDGETEDYLLEVSATSGLLQRPVNDLPFRLVPNPATDAFRIEVAMNQTDDVRVEMLGADGRVLNTLYSASLTEGTQTLLFNLDAGLPNGMYTVRITTASGNSGTQRLVVQR
jgi:hypothetical protein